MKPRSRKVCRWCRQPLPEWTDIWPHNPGIYLFYGYPVNISVDQHPRLMTVTVEGYSEEFGTIYRTPRSTLKPGTGAAGYWSPLIVPEIPAKSDVIAAGEDAYERVRTKPGPKKKINKRAGRRLK